MRFLRAVADAGDKFEGAPEKSALSGTLGEEVIVDDDDEKKGPSPPPSSGPAKKRKKVTVKVRWTRLLSALLSPILCDYCCHRSVWSVTLRSVRPV